MIDPARLLAFAGITATTSAVPGPSMVFVLTQSAWRGPRSAALALAGLQLGYCVWWILAALGLGTLLAAAPAAYHVLALAGAAYLGWLGIAAWRHAGEGGEPGGRNTVSARPLRDGIVVALGNPKSLIYMVAVIPPFIDGSRNIAPQLLVLALVAMVIDVMLAAFYIAAGERIARAMASPAWRKRMDRTVGSIFIALALAAAWAALDAP
ncbi:LysE family translocator [Parablastomonas sp. CN1-191]|uniref:LysE family translocator n=1 Tax=Parablastomonas sp. CN1-191 TaxID=3400908 RepID=UPI003BF7B1AD